jgi:hypothetical protein
MLGMAGRRHAELVEEASKVERPPALLIEEMLEHRTVLLAKEEDLRAVGEMGDAHEGIPG